MPKRVRDALGLEVGDTVEYEIAGDDVRLRKLSGSDDEYLRSLQASLSEWNSSEDAAAFDDL